MVHDAQGVIVADGELVSVMTDGAGASNTTVCEIKRIMPRYGFEDWKLPFPPSQEKQSLESVFGQTARFPLSGVKAYQAGVDIIEKIGDGGEKKQKQAVHTHATLSLEKKIVKWMVKEEAENGGGALYSRTVK
jgi:hypothetical protein